MSLEVGDIVQLDPVETANPSFAGCLMIVTDVKGWGVQGYVSVPAKVEPIRAFYRASTGTFTKVGKAEWVQE